MFFLNCSVSIHFVIFVFCYIKRFKGSFDNKEEYCFGRKPITDHVTVNGSTMNCLQTTYVHRKPLIP